jgi:REP element-mobilizing transposase RayT
MMPNHVHVLIETLSGHSVSAIVHSWKSFTANQANRTLARAGRLWAPDYFDRYMRNAHQLSATFDYIESNPVKAGLVAAPELWRWGSARQRAVDPTSGLSTLHWSY